MGFMAGFGQAFSQSFNDYNTQQAQKEQDVFKTQYLDYISRRDANEAIDRENAKKMKEAKALVKATGKPAEAWSDVYDMLQGGYDPKDVYNLLSTSNITVKQKTSDAVDPSQAAQEGAQADPRDSLAQGAQSAVQAQMDSSGMAGKAQGGIFGGNLKENMHEIFSREGATNRATDRAHQAMLQAAGVSEEDYQKAMAPRISTSDAPGSDVELQWSYSPFGVGGSGSTGNPAMDKALMDADTPQKATVLLQMAQRAGNPEFVKIAQANLDNLMKVETNKAKLIAIENGTGFRYERGFIRDGKGGWTGETAYPDYTQDELNPTWKTESGQPVPDELVAPISKNQEEDMKKVADEGTDTMKTYQDAKVEYKNFLKTSSDYVNALKDAQTGGMDGKAMDISGDISQFVDRWRRATVNLADLAFPKDPTVDADSAIGELDSAESKIRNQLASGKMIDNVSLNAMKASLIDIQGIKLAYQMAAQANGSTKGISNQDFQHFKDVVSGNGNPVTAAKGLSIFAKQQRENLRQMEGSVKQGKGAASYYKNKYHGAPNGFSLDSTIDSEIEGDKALADQLKSLDFDATTDTAPGTQINPPAKDMKIPEWAKNPLKPILDDTGKPVTDGMWQYLSPATIEAIKRLNNL